MIIKRTLLYSSLGRRLHFQRVDEYADLIDVAHTCPKKGGPFEKMEEFCCRRTTRRNYVGS